LRCLKRFQVSGFGCQRFELRVASYELRVAGCGLRVAGGAEIRKEKIEIRKEERPVADGPWLNTLRCWYRKFNRARVGFQFV
jgi:hypothetical protein